MSEYRVLYFRHGKLRSWEALEADNPISVVVEAMSRNSDVCIEVWRNDERVAIVRAGHRLSP